MENHLTIDQILAGVGADNLFEGSSEKTASAGPSKSSDFTDNDVNDMVSFLKEASLPQGEVSFKEKLASALLLNQSLQALTEGEPESSVKEASSKELPDEVKGFIKSAMDQGYTQDEALEFLEKQSSRMRGLGKGLAYASAAAGIGGGGYMMGKSKERKKAKDAFQKVMPKVHQHGLLQGKQRGFQMGAQKMDSAWKQKIQEARAKHGK